MMKITPKQAEKVHRRVRELCANCDEDGNCIRLDDGEAHRCVQLICTATISKMGYCPAIESCINKLKKATNQSKKRRKVK